jgi:hypothetical protein
MRFHATVALTVTSLVIAAAALIAGVCIGNGHGDIAWLWGNTRYRFYVDEGYFGCDINRNWGYPTAYPKHLTRQFQSEDHDLAASYYHEFPIPLLSFGFLCAIAPLAWTRKKSAPAMNLSPAQPTSGAFEVGTKENRWWELLAIVVGLSGLPVCWTICLMSPPAFYILHVYALAALIFLFATKSHFEGTALGSLGLTLAMLWAPLILLVSLVSILMRMQGGEGYNP